ncbi:MAG: P-loop NTPase [Verrucomicrobiales bacterium]
MSDSEINEETVLAALKDVKFPGFQRDIVSFGFVKEIRTVNRDVAVLLAVRSSREGAAEQILAEARARLQSMPGVDQVRVQLETTTPPTTTVNTVANKKGLPGVRRIIAVASGKGGVGKSTIATNLACALSEQGAAVGLCDLDIYGPSVALMMGNRDELVQSPENKILPARCYGMAFVSMGLVLEGSAPALLRGPMVTRITQQFLQEVDWGRLDYLVLDLPPGTGDVQITVAQTLAVDGVVLVTTPQEVALSDVRKAATMFHKVNTPIVGLIENMSYFLCPNDGNRYHIFGEGGGKREAQRLQVPLLAEVPIELGVSQAGDRGKPIVISDPSSASAMALYAAAENLKKALSEHA